MPVHVRCPHCLTPCVVAEQHRGVPVKCGRCGRSFTTRTEASSSPIRLDIAAAGATTRFLTQHSVFWNLDARHELAWLVLAGPQELGAAAAKLAPLQSRVLTGANPDTGGVAESINAAAVAIIWDGRLSLGGAGKCAIYHLSGGRLTRMRRDPVQLTAGDWLVFAHTGSQSPFDESILPREIAAAAASAAELAEHLAQRGGTIVAVRCY